MRVSPTAEDMDQVTRQKTAITCDCIQNFLKYEMWEALSFREYMQVEAWGCASLDCDVSVI